MARRRPLVDGGAGVEALLRGRPRGGSEHRGVQRRGTRLLVHAARMTDEQRRRLDGAAPRSGGGGFAAAGAGYVELHSHSAYSFLDGASLPEELVVQAAELGYEALALTDHDGLYGSLEFAHAAKALGVRPITGAEVTLQDGAHLTLLAETPSGY